MILCGLLLLSSCKGKITSQNIPIEQQNLSAPFSEVLPVSYSIKPTARPALTSTPTVTLTPTPSALSNFTPQPCSEGHGILEKKTVSQKGMVAPINLIIYLPPCYASRQDINYPVLYLIHGQKQNNEQWLRLDLTETADVFFSSGRVRPYIIVLPNEDNSLQDWSESPFDDDLVSGVIPWIDSNFHTCKLRSCRAIGGMSRGALWAVEIGLSRWQLFGSIGAHSLPGAPFSDSKTHKYLNAMKKDGYPHIYMDIGTVDDFFQANQVFKGYLDIFKIPYEWHLNPGGHTESYWRSHMAEYISWYGLQFGP